MFLDDDLPKKPQPLFTPAKLEGRSVEEMKEYIAELRVEAERVAGEIEKRGGHKHAAEALFRK